MPTELSSGEGLAARLVFAAMFQPCEEVTTRFNSSLLHLVLPSWDGYVVIFRVTSVAAHRRHRHSKDPMTWKSYKAAQQGRRRNGKRTWTVSLQPTTTCTPPSKLHRGGCLYCDMFVSLDTASNNVGAHTRRCCLRAFSSSETSFGGPIGLARFFCSSFGRPRIRLSVVSTSRSARFAAWAAATLTNNTTKPKQNGAKGVFPSVWSNDG